MTERGGRTPGSLVVDPGSMSPAAATAAKVAMGARARASNAVLVGRKRSATGHPLAVMGPQLGYYYPELFMEVDAPRRRHPRPRRRAAGHPATC